MAVKTLILPSEAIVNPANILFSSDPDKTEIQVYSHMKPLVYPEGVKCPVQHKYHSITYEWRSQLQDAECRFQLCWFVTIILFKKDFYANIGISPQKLSTGVWQKQRKNGDGLNDCSADVFYLSIFEFAWAGFGGWGWLQGWLPWEAARNFPVSGRANANAGSRTGQSWDHQQWQ